MNLHRVVEQTGMSTCPFSMMFNKSISRTYKTELQIYKQEQRWTLLELDPKCDLVVLDKMKIMTKDKEQVVFGGAPVADI